MRRAFLCALIALTLALPAQAGKLAGVTLPETVQVEGETLDLNGMGLRTRLFIKVYVAGLYLAEKSSSAEQILATDGARRLDMHFLRSVGSGSICGAWNDSLAANNSNPSAELKGQFEDLCQWMEDVEKGDTMVFSYSPSNGTRIEVKGQEKGVVAGKTFADALFASWIGAEPPSADFKSSLLGK
ncbi:MAG: chalcone isomerase family protein [Acidobacteriota bacterium]